MYKLPCDVRVGNGTFRKGVTVSTLQTSIDARVDYTKELEQRIQELESAIREHEKDWFEGMCWDDARKKLMSVLTEDKE